MLIRLSKQQESELLKWASSIASSHVEADCEPPGYELVITIAEPCTTTARAECGAASLSLGEVAVEFEGAFSV
jgi:hypothetical protein